MDDKYQLPCWWVRSVVTSYSCYSFIPSSSNSASPDYAKPSDPFVVLFPSRLFPSRVLPSNSLSRSLGRGVPVSQVKPLWGGLHFILLYIFFLFFLFHSLWIIFLWSLGEEKFANNSSYVRGRRPTPSQTGYLACFYEWTKVSPFDLPALL